MKLENKSNSFIGFLQALAVALYCGLVGTFMWNLPKFESEDTALMPIFMLMLLVFSAGLTGSFVFAYPAYLAMNKKVKKALPILGFTFFWLVIMALMVCLVMYLNYKPVASNLS